VPHPPILAGGIGRAGCMSNRTATKRLISISKGKGSRGAKTWVGKVPERSQQNKAKEVRGAVGVRKSVGVVV